MTETKQEAAEKGGKAVIVSLTDSYLKMMHETLARLDPEAHVARCQLMTAIAIERGNLVAQRSADLLHKIADDSDAVRTRLIGIDVGVDKIAKACEGGTAMMKEIAEMLDSIDGTLCAIGNEMSDALSETEEEAPSVPGEKPAETPTETAADHVVAAAPAPTETPTSTATALALPVAAAEPV